MMCDFMAPEGSIYYDAIYGAFDGQRAIRNWLIPTMATIDFIEFVPTAAPAVFDDGSGPPSLDEWQMFAVFGDDACRWRAGSACGATGTGGSPGRATCTTPARSESRRRPTPRPTSTPRYPTGRARSAPHRDPVAPDGARSIDFAALGAAFHPTDSVLHDPVVGELHDRDTISASLPTSAPRCGDVVYEPLGPRLDDGSTSVQEWQQMAVDPTAAACS